jgi:hypothetical protein
MIELEIGPGGVFGANDVKSFLIPRSSVPEGRQPGIPHLVELRQQSIIAGLKSLNTPENTFRFLKPFHRTVCGAVYARRVTRTTNFYFCVSLQYCAG